jgi:folate-dependent phosphoribosylglycinamide formyltransferase PurN
LCSQRAPGLEFLLADAARGRLWDLAVALSTDDAFAAHETLQGHGVPCLRHPIRSFYKWQRAPLSDLALRRDFDACTLHLLRPHAPDLVVLSGYLYVLTAPMLEAFPARIVNAHHSDLAAPPGRRYPGLHAVRDAILAGETETRATSHVVTAQVDAGPLLLRSWPYPVATLAHQAMAWGALDVVRTYAAAHQQWMLRTSFGPLLAGTIAAYARGGVRVRDGAAWIDGVRGPVDVPAVRPTPHLEAAAVVS